MNMEHKTIKADEGMVFRRIADGHIYGEQITLGYSYYIGGEKLAEPHLDVEEDFEQIPIPEEYKHVEETEKGE